VDADAIGTAVLVVGLGRCEDGERHSHGVGGTNDTLQVAQFASDEMIAGR
jgi:hypothetical protein